MERPSIAVDSKAQPHFVCDNGGKTEFMKFHKVDGLWSGGVFATGSRGGRYDASRLYVGQIEIDSRDRAWISCKFGVKEYGNMYGQGLWLFRNVASNPNPPEQFFRFVCVYKGMGVVTTDAKYPDQGVVIGTFGNYAILYADGQTLKTGSINCGPGGEKVRARIASYAPRFGAVAGVTYEDGIWHTAMNGYSACSSKYQNSERYKAGLGPVDWAAYSAYPQQGSDFSHPGLGIDLANPRLAYIASVFNGNLCVNIWDGERMRFDPSNLKVLDSSANYEVRHGPAFAPAPGGGTYIFWTSNYRIKMAWLSPAGDLSAIADIGSGRSPAAATDRFGNLHLVYYANGIRYRKILVGSLDPIEPQGRIADTRQPVFQWGATQATNYTLAIALDGEPYLWLTTATNAWVPASDLPVGAYTWSVKEGDEFSAEPWSRPGSFIIPPPIPTPVNDLPRYPEAGANPVFRWQCEDDACNAYKIQLFQGTEALGFLKISGDGKADTATWPDPLGPGTYQWRIKSLRNHPTNSTLNVSSSWSVLETFQVAVPASCAFVEPAALTAFNPGKLAIPCSWTPAEGADSYTLTALFNGAPLTNAAALTETQLLLARKFEPGYYSLLVTPTNAAGPGAPSPIRTFIVNRLMTPADGSNLAAAPLRFAWTRSRNASQYRIRLYRYDETLGRFKGALENWTTQPPKGLPSWTPDYAFTTGRYRWMVTDFTDTTPGFTSTASFTLE